MIKIEVESDIKDAFLQIALRSKESLIEQSSKAGNRVRVNSRNAMRRHRTPWVQAYVHGKRKIYKSPMARILGRRIAHRDNGGIDNPANMENFITSYTMERSGTTVIGGVHKGFRPKKIRDGKIVGTLPYVGGVSKSSQAILEKLNSGRLGLSQRRHLKWRTKDGGTNWRSLFKPQSWVKDRGFMQEGWRNSQGYIRSTMTTELARLIGKRANDPMHTKKEKYAV